MSIIYLYYNARMCGGGLKEMPCFRTHIKLVPYGFVFCFFVFLTELSYVGFVLVGDVLGKHDEKTHFTFVRKNKSSPMDLFLALTLSRQGGV